jgi:8-oxo-dGTP pyrophosphatase MutT (NUDIX family)
MKDVYTIYFGDKPYYIASELDHALQKLAATAGTIMANQADEILIQKTIRELDNGPANAVIVLTNHVTHAWEIFQKQFKLITAGGGIILNDNNEVLFIFRRGKWDLPKGKLDEGETIEDCSKREVIEETGLKKIDMLKEVGKTYHTYHEKKHFILKTTVWFLMKAPGNQELIPQKEEDIESMQWLGKSEWSAPFANTFPGIRYILNEATF